MIVNMLPILLMSFTIVNTLDAGCHAGENLVGDGAAHLAQLLDGHVLAEDFDRVAHLAGGIGHVNHHGIHADVADGGAEFAAHPHAHVAVAEVAVEAVGIADVHRGDAAVALQDTLAAVADGPLTVKV